MDETKRLPRRALVAEDDSAMRALMRRALTRAGFEVTSVGSGSEALERLSRTLADDWLVTFDLVISDVRMPGFDGLNVLASLREIGFAPPVILITAFGSAELHAAARRLGAFAVLDKPFALDQLVRVARLATGLSDAPEARDA